MLDRQSIIAAQDSQFAVVNVPEWGGDVRIRTLTAAERMSLYIAAQAGGDFDMRVFQPLLVAMTLVDEKGDRLFADDEVGIIAGKSASSVQVVFEASSKLSALGGNSVEAAAKNSTPTPSDASS